MKKISHISNALLLVLSVLFTITLSSGCTRVRKNPEISTRIPQRDSYEKLQNYQLQLDLLTPRRRFYAGEDVKLTYKLTNVGEKSLCIAEWYMNESDNIRLYYMPYRKKLAKFNSKDWILVDHDIKQPPHRFELVMLPKNSVLVDKTVPFIKAAGEDNPTVKRGKYYLIAELNLNSVDVRSKPIVISIP